jgi:hypothetical protein
MSWAFYPFLLIKNSGKFSGFFVLCSLYCYTEMEMEN